MTKLKPHPPHPKLKPIDSRGRRIHRGDWVRIIKMPQWLSDCSDCPDDQRIFKQALNKTFKVEGFNIQGGLELHLWKKLKRYDGYTFWLEPNCVIRSRLVKKSRKKL